MKSIDRSQLQGLLAPITLLLVAAVFNLHFSSKSPAKDVRPNILIAISDNQSHPHVSLLGDKSVKTPAFDRIAREGVLFVNAFAASPGCAPSRSSLLTGRYLWQNEEAGGHQTLFPAKYATLPDVLEEAGYLVGFTGKGCAPFNWKQGGRTRDPAGNEFNSKRYDEIQASDVLNPQAADPEAYAGVLSSVNYAANFESFLEQKQDGQPFFFWYGAREPHRPYGAGSGQKAGKRIEDVTVPGFLPDHPAIRDDMLDYALEIDWFDEHLMSMIQILEQLGELDNTLIIVTSDNGMQFPRAIADCYEYGLHVPMAISWPARVETGRIVEDLVSLADLAPTILEITGTDPGQMQPLSAKSFSNILFSNKSGLIDASNDAIFAGRERHSSARWSNLGYPERVIRTKNFLYIRNFYPERWPAGAPQTLDPNDPDQLYFMHGLDNQGKFTGEAYHDIDNGPTKTFLIENKDDPQVSKFFHLVVDKRPAEELYDIRTDPFCTQNLAAIPSYQTTRKQIKSRLDNFLTRTKDPRLVGPNPDIFENYQRFFIIRPFPEPDWIQSAAKPKRPQLTGNMN